MEFQKGEFVKLKNGLTIKIEKMLGKGGQGTVYEASKSGKKYALKWYFPEYLKQIDQKKFYSNLEKNIEAGTPSDMFLWPLEVSEYAKDSFGYLMELRPKNYKTTFPTVKSVFLIKARITYKRTQIENFIHKDGSLFIINLCK